MCRAALIAGAVLVGALALVWVTGGFDRIEDLALAAQREVQATLAAALRRLRAGEPGAVIGLLSVCFAYGFFHAAGPGHGKLLIGAYGAASGVRMGPLAGIAIASSLAQATTAVLLVLAGVLLLGWTRERLVQVSDQAMTLIGYGAFIGIGLWLALRGWRALRRQMEVPAVAAEAHDHGHHHGHHHDHHHGHHDHTPANGVACDCGHRHGPSLEEVVKVTSLREALVLIAGIALRPCTGAVFLLVLTWQMGLILMGIAGAYAMGLGTASVTLAVAVLSVWMREGTVSLMPAGVAARALPLAQIAFGGLIALVAADLLLRAA